MEVQKIPIRNKCTGLHPRAIGHIRRSLRWINPDYLSGISYIELIDRLPDVKGRDPKWYREARENNTRINGWYNDEIDKDGAGIVLHMPAICSAIPGFLWWTTVPTLLITKVLAHEIAHHLRYTRGYIFSRDEVFRHYWQEEAAADRYAYDLRREMLKKWSYWAGHEIIYITADVYYRKGVKRWEEKNYEKAASYWDKARVINSDHTYAAHWYWRALQMSQVSQESIGK